MRLWLPSNHHWLPSNHHRLPGNHHLLPGNHHLLPSNHSYFAYHCTWWLLLVSVLSQSRTQNTHHGNFLLLEASTPPSGACQWKCSTVRGTSSVHGLVLQVRGIVTCSHLLEHFVTWIKIFESAWPLPLHWFERQIGSFPLYCWSESTQSLDQLWEGHWTLNQLWKENCSLDQLWEEHWSLDFTLILIPVTKCSYKLTTPLSRLLTHVPCPRPVPRWVGGCPRIEVGWVA